MDGLPTSTPLVLPTPACVPLRATSGVSVVEIDHVAALRGDYELFARECLKIRTKAGSTVAFEFNAAQRVVHDAVEAQKREHGFVRALVLKGRQQGISTYVGGRFYHRTAMRKGVNTYILAHEQPASDTLFGMVDRYQRHNPLAPHVGISNTKELIFDKLDSSYAVATAGTKAGGRSKAISLFHGSEVAFWANAPDHFTASVQGVPLEPGTEVILESTSAGAGGEFYERWQDAEAERGDYIPIFLPWWLSPEYSRPPPPGFVLSQDADEAAGEMSEQEYADLFKVSSGQMFWRRNKIIELRKPELFQREYPATPQEAWTAPPGFEPFISSIVALRARKLHREAVGPLIIGVDPASNGGDRFSVAARRGQCVQWVRWRNKIDCLEGALWLKSLIDELNPVRMNIDGGNIGADIITLLKSYGQKYANVVRGVNFGGTSEAKIAKPKAPGPKNRRAEMWQRMAEWLKDPVGASLPDLDMLGTDLAAPRLKPLLTNDFLLESKQEMKKRGVRSPDLADAIALTFAFREHFERYQATEDAPTTLDGSKGLPSSQNYDYMHNLPPGGDSWMA